jgi:hypothetical protein
MGLFKREKEEPQPRAPTPTNPSALYANTQVVYQDPDFAVPPPLNYSLRTRKKSIAIFWTLILLDCVCLPIALYFGLWYGTSLSHNAGMWSLLTRRKNREGRGIV